MFKLALNAGHGKYTKGKRCLKKLDTNETREWVLNSRICEKIEILLKEFDGISIIRLDDVTGETDVPLKKRTDTANRFGADFYLSIHHNAGIKGGDGGGISTYVYTKPSVQSLNWQNALYTALLGKTKLKGNRSSGVNKANFHECRESKMPCVLIECGFMDSRTDVPIILSEDFANKVSEACVEVLIERANLKKKNVKVATESNIIAWQKAAIKDGFNFGENSVNGTWTNECEKVISKAICKKRVTYKYKNLTKIVQKAVGVSVDGLFGANTKQAVIKYQKRLGLLQDGIVGPKTWKKILGVK